VDLRLRYFLQCSVKIFLFTLGDSRVLGISVGSTLDQSLLLYYLAGFDARVAQLLLHKGRFVQQTVLVNVEDGT